MAMKYYDSPFNVGEDAEVASKLTLKADLMLLIRDVIEKAGLTQLQAAELLSVSQPRVSDLLNGKIDKFTLDMLFTMLDDLGFRSSFANCSVEESSISIRKTESFTACAV